MTDDPRIPPEDDELMRQADALIDGANTHEGRSRIGLLDSWYYCQQLEPDKDYSEKIRKARAELREWITEQRRKR